MIFAEYNIPYSSKSMKNSNVQFAHMIFFNWQQIVDRDTLKSIANSQELLHRLQSTNSL